MLFSSNRNFRIWLYMVSHGTLLLRSPKIENKIDTRIDVIFKPTIYINIPTELDGLSISIADPADPKYLFLNDLVERKYGENIYALSWNGGTGIVVSSGMSWHEDELDCFDRSHFSGIPRLDWDWDR